MSEQHRIDELQQELTSIFQRMGIIDDAQCISFYECIWEAYGDATALRRMDDCGQSLIENGPTAQFVSPELASEYRRVWEELRTLIHAHHRPVPAGYDCHTRPPY